MEKTKPLELTKEEALNLSMAYRNDLNKFSLNFKDFGDEKLKKAGQAYLRELELLQVKLEKFIDSF